MTQLPPMEYLATEFKVLLEIAAHQPHVQQKDIAGRLGLTPQAVSECVRKLVAEGLVAAHGRSRYTVSKEGVDWILRASRQLQDYLVSVSKVITDISITSALAEDDLAAGQVVSLRMERGMLWASAGKGGPARGVAITDALQGEEVGVTNIEGIILLEVGEITIGQVPRVHHGGSGAVDLDQLRALAQAADWVAAVGLEARLALQRIGVAPDALYGVSQAVGDAATAGFSCLVVCADDAAPALIQELHQQGLSHSVVQLARPDSILST